MSEKKSSRKKTFSRRSLLLRPFQGIKNKDNLSSLSGFDSEHREGDRALKRGNYSEAKEYYQRCISQNPNNMEALKRLGFCSYHLKEFDEAQIAFKRVLQQKEKDSFAVLYLGLIHASTGDLPAAFRTWEEYFNLDQPLILREINLQRALLETDDPPEAWDVLQAVEGAIAKQKEETPRFP